MDISIVIPVYNSETTLRPLIKMLESALQQYHFEVILVNDCSKDKSEALGNQLATEKVFVKFISLRRNYGEHNAVMCGLNFTTGKYVIIMDDDLQNPPSELHKMIDAAKSSGADVIYSKYATKKHHFFRNLGSQFNNYISTTLLEKPKDLYLSSFKLIRGEVVQEIIKYKGPFPYVDGLIWRVTNSYLQVEVEHLAREEGASNYTLKKLIGLYLNMFLNFSIKPIRFFTYFGFGLVVFGFVFALLFLIEKLLYPDTPLGWTSIIVTMILFSGTQIVFMGLLGEYLGKNYLDQNSTPQWTIKSKKL